MLDNVPPPIPPLPNMGMLQRMPAQPGGVPITTQPMPMNVVPPASVPRPGMPPVMSGASPLPQQGLINKKIPFTRVRVNTRVNGMKFLCKDFLNYKAICTKPFF